MAAFDLSENSVQGVHYAVEMAENLNAELLVVSVIDQRDLVAVREAVNRIGLLGKKFSISIDSYTEGLKQERTQQIEKLIKDISCSIAVQKIIKIGIPFLKIIEAVKESHADILVMGIKGRSNLAETLFGSTAEKMFRHCPVPLLSIRMKQAV